MNGSEKNRIVYSTLTGRMCPECHHPASQCVCKKAQAAPKIDGIVRVQRQTKGRGGKDVTLIHGVSANPEVLQKLAKELKQRCGTGGTVKDWVIEIQGDQRKPIVEALTKKGYTVKLAGG